MTNENHNLENQVQDVSPQVDNSQAQADQAVEQNSPQDGQLLGGKFKSQEDLLKAYKELEKASSQKSEELSKYRKAFDLVNEQEDAQPTQESNDLAAAVEMLAQYFPTKDELAQRQRVDNYFSDVAPDLVEHKDKIQQWGQLPENQGKSIEEVADSYQKTFLKNLPADTKPSALGQNNVPQKELHELSREELIEATGLSRYLPYGVVQKNVQGRLRRKY
jgi:hypothetical protein